MYDLNTLKKLNEGESMGNIKVNEGDLVEVKLIGPGFKDTFGENPGLFAGQHQYGTVSGPDGIELDWENPFSFSNPKLKIWGVTRPDARFEVEILHVCPKEGDKVKILVNDYGDKGMIGTVTKVHDYNRPSSTILVTVKVGDRAGLNYYLRELEKIELPEEQPLAEWERELLGMNDEDGEKFVPKFKAGDKVRVTKKEYMGPDKGALGEISDVDEEDPDLTYRFVNADLQVWWLHEDTLEAAPVERDDVKVGDTVFLLEDDVYGINAGVAKVHQDRILVVCEQGTYWVDNGDFEVLPNIFDVPMGIGLILGMVRELGVHAGALSGATRPIIKQQTEKVVNDARDFLKKYQEAGAERERVAAQLRLDKFKDEVMTQLIETQDYIETI